MRPWGVRGWSPAFAVAIFYEPFKFWLLVLFLPLYSRINKDDLDKSIRRGELIGYIRQNPGASFTSLRKDMMMGNGQLTEHLQKLENGNFIKSRKLGARKCFYPRDYDLSRIPPEAGHPIQKQIVGLLTDNPGLNQKELASVLGLPRKTVGYHMNSLVLNRRVRIEKRGRERRYFLIDK